MLPIFAEPRSAYIHVPFCRHRCGYCDFTLVAGRDQLIDRYLQALDMQLQSLERSRPVETLFFGGGTPTHPAPARLRRLFGLVRKWLPPAEGCEFSVEANPADLDDEKIGVLADAGVNRVSLGVQSFDAGVLELLERDHRREDIVAAVERLRSRFGNISIDLIFGVPGQSLELWRETLAEAILLGPTHISTYGLTIEKGTSFWTRREQGALQPPEDELQRAMYAAAIDDLAAAGFEQYEISNFARPGFACRHNEVYWRGFPYFGFGPGAASYIGGRREINHRSVTTWLNRIVAGESAIGECEQLSPEERAREAIAIGLRRTAGIDRDEFRRLTGFELDDLAADAVEKFVRAGWIEETPNYVRLTRAGRFVADTVVAEFL